MRAVLAILVAATAAGLFSLSTTLQAIEAKRAPHAEALQSTLLLRLLRRRVWLLGAAAGVAGWGMQAAALAVASVAIVQPALGLGLVVQLYLGRRLLGESVGRVEALGVMTVVAGVALLGWAAPSGIDHFTRNARLGVAAAGVALAAAPHALRLAGLGGGLATSILAGVGWAWVGVATALVDRALGHGELLAALPWAVGVGVVTWSALVVEMSAFQKWPVTRSFPLLFGLEMALPAAFAPILTHGGVGPAHGIPFGIALAISLAGAVVLGSSRSVARAAAT